MSIRAVLFDIDGTLVDSNYLHIDAWHRAFADLGAPVDAWRIHRDIGMDSGGLLDDLLGDRAEELGDRAKDEHTRLYREQAPRLRPLPGARELIGALRERGLIVVLATSAPADELELLLGVLGVGEGELPTTDADDVDEAKPHPGIVQIALDRAGVGADEAVFVGDSVWDMVAAGRAGVAAVGVRSGGVGADELADGGAGEVVDGVSELLARGDAWPPRMPEGA
ncbi:HAD family hydrolase [Pseudolysinimonas sp.]|uniref:HAD family hydrolase n=1 Tax=Pseudolysinimonas sp. TaxID=2680009 RepID=UPI003F7F9595